jgi:Ca2+-binding EF-hand superfamily protein
VIAIPGTLQMIDWIDFKAAKGERADTRELFKCWDYNNDGKVSKKEFFVALPAMGFELSTKAMEDLFEALDQDSSGLGNGELVFSELDKRLRRVRQKSPSRKSPTSPPPHRLNEHGVEQATVEEAGPGSGPGHTIGRDPKPGRAYGGGYHTAERAQARAQHGGERSEGFTQMLKLMRQNGDLVVSKFKVWDKNSNGTLSKPEFKEAITRFINLVHKTPSEFLRNLKSPQDMDELFDFFDEDTSFSISIDEFKAKLEKKKKKSVDAAQVTAQASAKEAPKVELKVLCEEELALEELRKECEATERNAEQVLRTTGRGSELQAANAQLNLIKQRYLNAAASWDAKEKLRALQAEAPITTANVNSRRDDQDLLIEEDVPTEDITMKGRSWSPPNYDF